MTPTRGEVSALTKGLSFEITEHEIGDYEALLARTQNTLELVAAMEVEGPISESPGRSSTQTGPDNHPQAKYTLSSAGG
ncbi:Amidase [Penicillium paradoxum]|uniref:Amidase n=1 Tax=Penicillium paradoxum TaxID=176176 RepID=UPI002548608A|nr:Amidase [Penicillium paradoxum]KAJ5773641.1 Amidase [Penicillium paradoxum]